MSQYVECLDLNELGLCTPGLLWFYVQARLSSWDGSGGSFLICSQPILLPSPIWPGWDLLPQRQETESHQQWLPRRCVQPRAGGWEKLRGQGTQLAGAPEQLSAADFETISRERRGKIRGSEFHFIPLFVDTFKRLTNIWACIYECQEFQSLQQDEAVCMFIFLLLPSCFSGFAKITWNYRYSLLLNLFLHNVSPITKILSYKLH